MSGKVIFSLTDDQAGMLAEYVRHGRGDDGMVFDTNDRRTRTALRDKGLLVASREGYVLTAAGQDAARLVARLAVPSDRKHRIR